MSLAPSQTPLDTPPAPRRRHRATPMPQEQAEARYPSLRTLTRPGGPDVRRAWVATFRAQPEAVHRLIGDVLKQIAASGRVGQRPMPREADVDLAGLLWGETTDKPIHEALPGLMRVSERAFAARTHMTRSTLQRLLAGRHDPDVAELRAIAAAVHKPPAYFVEYRVAMSVAAFVRLLEVRPGFATTLYRQFIEVGMAEVV